MCNRACESSPPKEKVIQKCLLVCTFAHFLALEKTVQIRFRFLRWVCPALAHKKSIRIQRTKARAQQAQAQEKTTRLPLLRSCVPLSMRRKARNPQDPCVETRRSASICLTGVGLSTLLVAIYASCTLPEDRVPYQGLRTSITNYEPD